MIYKNTKTDRKLITPTTTIPTIRPVLPFLLLVGPVLTLSGKSTIKTHNIKIKNTNLEYLG